MQWPSFTFILSQIFLAYVIYSIYQLSLVFMAPRCEEGKPCLNSYISFKPRLELYVYSSVRQKPLKHDRSVDLVYMSDDFDYLQPSNLTLLLNIPERTRNNGTLFLHIVLARHRRNKGKRSLAALQEEVHMASTTVKITRYMIPEAKAFNLLGDKDSEARKARDAAPYLPVTHLRTKIKFTVMTDDVDLPIHNLPLELIGLVRVIPGMVYLPIMNYDFLHSRYHDLVEISPQNTTANFTLFYSPTSIGKLRLVLLVKSAMENIRNLGFSKKDIDDVKGLFVDTNIYFLGGTFFIAAVHLLFDFLVFKNDISFWRSKNNLIGVSKWTVMWRCFSQAVIFLYLLNEGASLLVLIPAGIGSIIEIWKLRKVLLMRFKKGASHVAEIKTQEFDLQSMRYLSYLLYPIVIGGSIYSLLYHPHKSWYSWCLNLLANGVYAFGFLFMLPQLFVNYKLKSVAHLPWKTFMYKAFNTFIDDVFAFIITMPTAHRIACFRDDIVFLVYLYQRWLYPVDKKRVDLDTSTEESIAFSYSDTKED